jgi:hypothetical protein
LRPRLSPGLPFPSVQHSFCIMHTSGRAQSRAQSYKPSGRERAPVELAGAFSLVLQLTVPC